MTTQETIRPPDVSKADVRRSQILDAAAKCFNKEGFHSASMAKIATEASVSVGQIYRYFENKEAVIAALVEQHLVGLTKRIAEVRGGGDPLEELLEIARYYAGHCMNPERAALKLEFLAEAARNPRIGEIVRMDHDAVRGHIREILVRNRSPLKDCDLDRSVDLIATFLDGWSIHAVKDRNATVDSYIASLRPLVKAMLVD